MDAALDEPNQARVAELLRQLACGSGSSSCQILAVTHNAAFQAFGQTVQVAATPSQVCCCMMRRHGEEHLI